VTVQTGALSIESRNIFTLLRTSLYSEQDIVFRELVSNASDAIAKRAVVDPDAPVGRIDVVVDAATGVVTVTDNGVGMSSYEVDRYINQIALSGASDFVRRLHAESSDDGTDPGEEIIGHFGVGFYSAFMLSDTVMLDTLSHEPGSQAVHWECGSDMEYALGAGARADVGTSVTLTLDPASPYLKNATSVRTALTRYFAFLGTPVYYRFRSQDGVDDGSSLVNDPSPVWKRHGREVTDHEVCAFYREHFEEAFDPLAWYRVESVDLGLQGMVFVRDTRGGAEAIDGRVEIFSRGVFVDANLPQFIPKFVNLQHAIIECDQLPLVVSRGQVRSGGPDDVPALVAECLSQESAIWTYDMFTENRSRYAELWPELAPFIKYGVLTDRIFSSVMTRRVLFSTVAGSLVTLSEYLDQVTSSYPGTVFYTSDPLGQAAYVDAYRASGVPALILDHVIDQPLLHRLEAVTKDVRFVRLDAEASRVLALDVDPADAELAARVVERFSRVAAERLPGVAYRPVWLRVADLPVVLTSDEGERRMSDLAQVSGLAAGRTSEPLVVSRTLLANLNNPMVRRIGDLPEPLAATAVAQLVDLTLLAQDELSPEELLAFLARSQDVLAGYLNAHEE
jgi:molecular chaperone HtpG